jgi:transcriptional regulator with XRE-family HTH domain
MKDTEFIRQTGANLRSIRKASGLSCEQIAEALTISTSAYRHLETGYAEMSVSRLKELAEILSVNMGAILGESTEVMLKLNQLQKQIIEYNEKDK